MGVNFTPSQFDREGTAGVMREGVVRDRPSAGLAVWRLRLKEQGMSRMDMARNTWEDISYWIAYLLGKIRIY